MAKKKIAHVVADWKDTDGLIESFKEALKEFGLKVTDDPVCDGTDTIGLIISEEEPKPKKNLPRYDKTYRPSYGSKGYPN